MSWTRPTLSSAERGYGAEHRKMRAQWAAIVDLGEATCCLCGQAIHPGAAWHLDHTPDRTAYRGPAHATCNVVDGAKRGKSRQGVTRIQW